MTLLFDSDLRLSAMNSAAENLLFCSARKVHALHVAELFSNDTLVNAVNRAMTTGQPLTEWDVELDIPLAGIKHVDCILTPLTEMHPSPGILIEMIDVEGHRRILREENILTLHNIAQTMVREIAHEVKNPLGGIRGAAQLLHRELGQESQREHTRLIIEEADRLRGLLDRMLAPNSLPRKTTLNIHEVVEHVRNLIEAETRTTLTIVRDYDPSLPELRADRGQLIQALLNIARNAVQALNGIGKITLRTRSQRLCTIGTKLYKLAIRVDVIDNGPGIPPNIKDDIFFPMVTGRADGTGLGLPIAQTLIRLQGGVIECASRPGETVFTLLLPIENGE